MVEIAGLLSERLLRLPERHRAALSWFMDHAGGEESWPAPIKTAEGETLLAARPKGIYKPVWSEYALSVRQSLAGPYPDREPVLRSDGTWLFSYFQENRSPTDRDDEYTNRGMIACWRDGVPVGVMRQVRENPSSRYQVLGVALVAGWDGGYFFLEGFASTPAAQRSSTAGAL
jgi:putative restriction endonuclease